MNDQLLSVSGKVSLDSSSVGTRPSVEVRSRRSAGLTLLELLVVVAIIGLLAGYVGPRFFSQIGKSEVKAARAQLDAFDKALATYCLDIGRWLVVLGASML